MISEVLLLASIIYTSGLLFHLYCFEVEQASQIDLIAPKLVPSYDAASEDEFCPICLDSICNTKKDVRKTMCNHTFCSSCITEWLTKKPVCPLCNHVLVEKK